MKDDQPIPISPNDLFWIILIAFALGFWMGSTLASFYLGGNIK
jgi:hypothetical protein